MIVLRTAAEGSAIALEPIPKAAANTLGQALAAIDPWARYPIGSEVLTAYLGCKEGSAPRYLIRVDRTVAGAIGIRENWMRGPYLQFLGLLPQYQRDGIGRLVLAWFEGTARERGDGNLWVAASDFNTAAVRFYERHGFVRAALLDDLISDGKCEVLLRKKLGGKK